MAKVVVALGANVGDPIANLQIAVKLIAKSIHITKFSRVYRTAPMYLEGQPDFLNAAIIGTTDLGPLALLATLKAIEQRIGRRRRERNGPREVDLDLIAYGSLRYRFTMGAPPYLEIPHPRAHERRFVLAPLADLDPDFELIGHGVVRDLLALTESQASDVLAATNLHLESVLPHDDAVL